MLSPIALGDRDDQLLADVAWEVEVDVRHRRKLVVQEPSQREVVCDRIDVGEAGEVADDRADRAAASAPWWQEVSRRVSPAHLERRLAGELEHLVVEEEEARQAELVDQRELVVEASARLRLVTQSAQGSVALVERVAADLRELEDRRLLPVGEVGIAVAELLGQVELEPAGELDASLGCRTVEGEALEHLLGSAKEALTVSAPLRLASFERGSAADRNEDVLEQRAPRVMRMHVAGRDRLHAEVLREVAEQCAAPGVSPFVRPLELDEEALPSEGLGKARCAVRVPNAEAVACTAGQADEAFGELCDELERNRRAAAVLGLRDLGDAFPHGPP